MTPPALDRLVQSCLAKEPDDRFQTAHDVKLQLQWIAEGGSLAGLPAPVVAKRRSRGRAASIVAGVAALAALALGIMLLGRPRETPRMVQSSILPPEKSAFVFFEGGPMALSPDGRRLVFLAPTAEGKNLLWVRPLNAVSAQPLAGTEGASYPFCSPDSRYLGFFAAGKLKRIDASGGPPQTLCDASSGRGGTWSNDGVILFVPSSRDPIHRVSSSGGAAAPVTRLDGSQGEFSHRWPFFLPDGRHFLYLAQVAGAVGQQEPNGIYLGSLDSKDRRLLFRANSNAAYAPSFAKAGYVLFLRERTLLARPFDAKRLQLTGEAFPVGEQVQYFPPVACATFSVSENGILAYQASAGGGLSQLVWFDRDGKQLESVGPPAEYSLPRLSHGGRRVAVAIADPQTGHTDIWLYDLPRRVSTRFTFGPAGNFFPVWSPDDSRIIFSSNRKGTFDLYQKAASGAGTDEVIRSSATSVQVVTDWSQDGGLIAFQAIDPKSKTGWDLWVFSVSDRKVTSFLSTSFAETTPQFSPDGRWMAYASDESGKQEVYVQPFPGPGGKWQVSNAGGGHPRWRRDGKEIFYVGLDKKLMAVEVTAGSGFEAGVPRPLFKTQIKRVTGAGFEYDVSPDGKGFLVNTIAGEEKSNPITLVQNWTAELKK